MIIVLEQNANQAQIERILTQAKDLGLTAHQTRTPQGNLINVMGVLTQTDALPFVSLPGVAKLTRMDQPYYLASRECKAADTVIQLPNGATFTTGRFTVIGGPCSVESYEQTYEVAAAMREAGVKVLRGGAFKPRTSPYSFRGLGQRGLDILAEVKAKTGLAVITEVMSAETLGAVSQVADILQIGSRNMQNYDLLVAAGRQSKPVLLKRGMASTLDELLQSAEYILTEGNTQVILCERGIRTFERSTRNTLDLSAVPVLRSRTHLPVIIDPSHSTGRSQWVDPMCRAAVAVGAAGIIVEVHGHPEQALCDGEQALTPKAFHAMLATLKRIAAAVDTPLN